MPKGKRGTRGKSKGKKKPNFVRMAIKVVKAPPDMTKDRLREILKESIMFGHKPLPESLDVRLGWRNQKTGPLKWDEFNKANIESSESSRGWDTLVLNYLDNN